MDADDAPTEILRIRLWNRAHATALLAECEAADRVLARWADRAACEPVGFEVTFIDGNIVRGIHEFFHQGKRKCLFSTHVRRLLRRAAVASGAA
ncbi:hypothetical protein [Herbaspirillum sp. SJZ107]|uniref:hypothetical protein n=1 Tax=Herbaspirillum sp. SJZ107 TaxID=2572881 RepID=UPI001154B6E3|nr:hypothetical protein [Herbaspirillum sp. SJZ107]TQK04726.1 hypothetical protein FBX97_3687 [Herbaspirillum sp. SJZ107]